MIEITTDDLLRHIGELYAQLEAARRRLAELEAKGD